ncbi:sulfate transport system permease protein [Dyella sp. OK004]|uniref:sulfate ABC transporter permease subunit CysW n=1 Tax=Dyella sp. OK004 TaxID=1855292 RepID=UPI0008F44222|nr:sulfate ABC transporter permease subunit CysW [Dyella sp. OK004]SFS14512.1 sulfate transport system permease protein [Dyella sp. OK004]
MVAVIASHAIHRSRGLGVSVGRGVLIVLALLCVAGLLLLPLIAVFVEALGKGWQVFATAISDPDARTAVRLTLTVAAIAVPANMVFGLAAAWLMTHYEFRGKQLLGALIDLPFSVSPVVAGLVYVLVYGVHGWFGDWLDAHGVRVIFAVPGLVLATIFVAFPFVARELIPLMQAQGNEEEHAARTLGANGWQIFFRVTLPKVRWALLYGVLLCNARSMGEFGAVSVVSGHLPGLTNTLPLQVDQVYNGGSDSAIAAAFALASLLALLTLLTLLIKRLVEWRHGGELAHPVRRH